MDRDTVLAFIASQRTIWVRMQAICDGLGLDYDALWLALADLAESGEVECGELPGGRRTASLTPLSASRLGLEAGPGGRWLREGKASSPRRPTAGRSGTVVEADLPEGGPRGLDEIPGREARPDQEAEVREGAEANPAERRGDYLSRPLQQPTRLHGSTATWPLPGHRADDGRPMPPQAAVGDRRDGGLARYVGPCSGCGGAPFTPADYCLACGRSGQDHLIPKVQAARAPAKPPKAARFRPRARKGKAG